MSLKIFIGTVILFLVLLLWSISGNKNKPYAYTENVLTDGMSITVQTHIEKLTIEGLEGTRRKFTGEGWSKVADLIPRQTRWYGSLGLYDPADSNTQSGRLLVDEGRQFFDSEEEALRYLCEEQKKGYKIVYSNHGLSLSQDKEPTGLDKPIRFVNIWQIYINGKKPTSLKGANDEAIQVTGGIIPAIANLNPAKVGCPREMCSKEEFEKSEYWQKVTK